MNQAESQGEASRHSEAATFRDVEKYTLKGDPLHNHFVEEHSHHQKNAGKPTVCWGPVTSEEAQAAGCMAASVSILLKPADVQSFVDAKRAAMLSIHPDIYPRSTDDSKSLKARLNDCTFLDEINAKWQGHGKNGKRVRLNKTTYSQPRRATFSVIARDRTCPETEWLYAYTQHGRPPEDFRCRPMPMSLFEFGVALWMMALPFMLGDGPSLLGPPTALQIMACEMPILAHGHGCVLPPRACPVQH